MHLDFFPPYYFFNILTFFTAAGGDKAARGNGSSSRMSGIFWEQERQPNLCEAASGFTFSTINLLVAIPMALVDLTVSGLLAVWSLILGLLLPILEAAQSGLAALAEVLGITEMPADTDLLVPGLAVTLLATIYAEHRHGISGHQLASKYSLMATGLLWLGALHAAPSFAVAPSLVVVSLALGAASFLPGLVVAMAANFRPTALTGSAFGGLLEVAGGLSRLLNLEAGLVLVIAAFGYPELLSGLAAVSEGAELLQYLCALPLCACILVYSTLKLQQTPLRSEDSHDGAPTVNGTAVGLREGPSSAAPETEAAPVEAVEPVPEEEQAANAAEETIGSVEDEAAEAEVAPVSDVTTEPETPVQPADESQQQPEEAKTEEAVEPIEVKEDILLAKIKSQLCGLAGGLCGRLSALVCVVRGWLAALGSLPWLRISLMLTTSGSHLLAAAAWNVLAANQLTLLLPLFTLVLPVLLDR